MPGEAEGDRGQPPPGARKRRDPRAGVGPTPVSYPPRVEAAWSQLGLGYRSTAECRRALEDWLPQGGRRESAGQSHEGRPIDLYVWTIGPDGAPPERAPISLFLLSSIHPMEWIGREAHLGLLEDILTARLPLPPGSRVFSVLDANPDGTARVEASLRAGRPAWVRGNARGVDLNRNFPVGFRTRPSWIDFFPMWRPGPEALSEPESRAVLAAGQASRAHLTLSFHSFGRWIFHPPSATRGVDETARRHGTFLAQALSAAPANGYRWRQLGRYARWFRAHGTEIDTLCRATGGHACLVELSWGGFARWGFRRLPHPFFTFNPPRPEMEIARLRPWLHALVREVVASAVRDSEERPPRGSGRRT